MISLTEGKSFDPSCWNGEVVHKGEIFRHLGILLGVDISPKQPFEWMMAKVRTKMQRWDYVLLPFPSKVKIINAYMIRLISFHAPLLKMAKIHWKEFLKPIKRFLWCNNSKSSSPWQWCNWHRVASPKLNGSLGILDPAIHANALCAKFLNSLAFGQ